MEAVFITDIQRLWMKGMYPTNQVLADSNIFLSESSQPRYTYTFLSWKSGIIFPVKFRLDFYQLKPKTDLQFIDNIALKRTTNQSSTCYAGDSKRAVDGDASSFYGIAPYTIGTCSHTCPDDVRPWWMVDFGKKSIVYSVNITNRGQFIF